MRGPSRRNRECLSHWSSSGRRAWRSHYPTPRLLSSTRVNKALLVLADRQDQREVPEHLERLALKACQGWRVRPVRKDPKECKGFRAPPAMLDRKDSKVFREFKETKDLPASKVPREYLDTKAMKDQKV